MRRPCKCAASLDDPKTVLDFISALPACQAKLANYTQNGNVEIMSALDGWLDKAAAGV